MDQVLGRYVVIGASGILAPLGLLLRSRQLHTVGISRGSRLEAGVWDQRVALDTQDAVAVTHWVALQRRDVAAVIAYSPALAPPSWPMMAGLAEHVMVVATSRWGEPGSPDGPWASLAAVVVVQLGWAQTVHGSRWHTPCEVSAAVAHELAKPSTPRTVVVGSLRPWSARPD